MISVTVGDFKSRFSDYLDSVINGEDVEILYGRAKKPVAKFTKIKETEKRNIWTLDGISSFFEIEDGKISMEEFLGIEKWNIF